MPFHFVDAAGARVAGVAAGGALVVGRSAECAIVLSDPTVSRRHAELVAAEDHVLVHDLGSRNGTFRNGLRVDTARLRAGDVVTFGVVPLRVEHDGAVVAWTGDDRRASPPAGVSLAPGERADAAPAPPPTPARSSVAIGEVGRPVAPWSVPPLPGSGPRGPMGGGAPGGPVSGPNARPLASAGAGPPSGAMAGPPSGVLDLSAFLPPRQPGAPDQPMRPEPGAPLDGALLDPAEVGEVAAASLAAGAPGVPVPPAVVDEEYPIVAERESPHELTRRRLGQLIQAAKALGGAAEVAAVHERIVSAALRTLDADRAAIAPGATADQLVPAVMRDRWGADLCAAGQAAIPRSIARAVFARRTAVLTADASADPRFVGQSVLYQRVRSALCAPLAGADGTPVGVLYVDSADPARRFDEADLDFLAAFAGLATAALENARLAERLRREAVARENFSRYFAPPVAERIAAAEVPARPGGERRTVSVLFADLRGFTRLAGGLAPDDVAATLSDFLSAMVECVFRHGGTLDKFIGDCVMAQWGAPESAPDDADRALRAALDMLVALDVLNAARRTAGRPVLGMGVGLAHGEVFAGNIGSERRLEFTVIGDVVNLASRLCDAAAGGELLVSEALRLALRDPAPRMRAVVPPPALAGYANPPAVWSLTLATAAAGAG